MGRPGQHHPLTGMPGTATTARLSSSPPPGPAAPATAPCPAASADAFLDDTRDFGEPGLGRDVTALYEIRLHPEPEPDQTLLTVELR